MLEKDLPIVGADFDGVIAQDIQTMSIVLQKNFYILDSEFWTSRKKFLQEPRYVSRLRPSPGIFTGIPIVANYSSRLALISARLEDLKMPIQEYLGQYNRLQYFDDFLLRSQDQDPLESKIGNVKKAGATYMIEDDPEVAAALEKEGVIVFFIDGLLNTGMENTSHIRIYEGVWDIAWDLVRKGSFQNILSHHRWEVINLADLKKVHKVEPPCRDNGTLCKIQEVCFPRPAFWGKRDPYQVAI